MKTMGDAMETVLIPGLVGIVTLEYRGNENSVYGAY